MAKWIGNGPCSSCPSSDGMATYDDGSTYCFVCKTYLGGESDKKNVSIKDLPIAALKGRGTSLAASQFFGVRVEYDEGTGEERKYYFETPTDSGASYLVRELPKNFYRIGETKVDTLWGMHLVDDNRKLLIITEGHEDAMAAWDMLQAEGKDYSVVSMPNGANLNPIKKNLEWLEGFESVIFCFDQDKPGREAAAKAVDMLTPGKGRVCILPEKDANEMLRKGLHKQFLKCIFSAKESKPDGIVGILDIYEDAIRPVEMGLPWPWPTLTRLTFGRRRKELYGFGAGTGAGKTEAFKEVIQHTVEELNLPVGLFFLEEHPAHTAKVIAGKIANKPFHVPDAGWTPEELQAGIAKLEGKVFMYNHFGQKDWKTIKPKIRYMVVSLGIKDIFLDHLTALVAGEASESKVVLDEIMADMAALTQELDFTLYYISHLSTPEGKPHEEGGRVTVSQFRGSRSIGFWSHYIFGLERNQQAENEYERNTVVFRVLKDRYTGQATGVTFPLTYNKETGRFLEPSQQGGEF